MTDWHPEQELAALLDALTEEILTMSARDIAVGQLGRREEVREAAQEMRRLVAATESGLNPPPTPVSAERSHRTQKHMN